MTGTPTTDDHALAARLAGDAGRVLTGLRADLGFADPGHLRASGDRRAHEFLVAALGRERPGDAVLSEEGAADPRRLDADRVWIVDPLDGSREYAEPGRTDWAVHVALWERGALVAGAVAVPARDLVLTTADPPRPRPDRATSSRLRLAVSRTRPPELTTRLAEALGARVVPMGSAGVKIAAVLLGEADAYVHAGGQHEWDSAAPVAVAVAAGCHASRTDGSPLVYNRAGAWLPDLVVCRPGHRSRLLAAIHATTHPTPSEKRTP
ncbi:3'(2'),5'-bisphosphate nucleotidase CysQ [Actinosynnema sp. NPDC023587]|uniref:3'(2'),5'-bisphosphate nucleotidase CysQ n=1 Tax=Actinosynnema sp. NPDC023587 TaxID=3154695 RepID=UPI0033F45C6A